MTARPPNPRRRTIKQRILTGAILLPLLILFLLGTSAFWLLVVISVINLLALREYFDMALPQQRLVERRLGLVCGVVLLPVLVLGDARLVVAGLTLISLLLGSWFLFRFQDLKRSAGELALTGFGLLYVPLLLAHVPLLFGLSFGRDWIFLVLIIVMAADTAAYFVGSAIGRRPLYPAISPKKSREGAIGGLFGSLFGALLAKAWFFPELSLFDALATGLLLSCSGQIGDLFESMLKRSFEVKDSGNLIPGHGGMLDRLDSLLFAFPVCYYYAIVIFPRAT